MRLCCLSIAEEKPFIVGLTETHFMKPVIFFVWEFFVVSIAAS